MPPPLQTERRRMALSSTAIRIILDRIEAAIDQKILAQSVATKSKRIGDPQQDEFWGQLVLYEQDLRRILRQLVGRQVALENERSLLWRIPRQYRYSARQSVNDRESATLDLVEQAEAILRKLLELSGDAATMKPSDWEAIGEKAMELADKLDHALVHTVVQQVQKGPAFTSTALPGLGLDHLAPLVGLLIAYIMSKRKRRD
jgi:hypothetical protein